jgi:hypothetical protein
VSLAKFGQVPSALKGIFWANVIGFALLVFINAIAVWKSGERGFVLTTGYVLVPFVIGFVSAFFWKDEDLTASKMFLRNALNVLTIVTISHLFAGEGWVCLMIIFFMLAVMVGIGFTIGWGIYALIKWLKENNKPTNKTDGLKISLGVLLAMAISAEVMLPKEETRLVGDDLIIRATPQTVWKYVVAFPEVQAESKFWLFDIGLPRPVKTTVSDFKTGAERKCIFSGGVVFDEVMTTFEPENDLTFEITGQPDDPEILGHLTLEKGQFLIKDNHDGTVTLTGNSWYRLHVFPAWYYDWWAEKIVRAVHLRVMEHIKTLAEAGE